MSPNPTTIAKQALTEEKIDPALDLEAEIIRLKKELNGVLLAHFYQEGEIQDLADYVGDSLQLAQQAQNTTADVIIFCGVHFMAETAKILNPEKLVLVPDLTAGCSLADGCPADALKAFRGKHPNHIVITYVNTTAAVKAISDIVCTSGNAEKIIRSVPENQPIIFAPDKHLGNYLMRVTGRKMLLWDAVCEVHENFSAKSLAELSMHHPDAKIIAHPECDEGVLLQAHFVGSTAKLLSFVEKDSARKFIVATEPGIFHKMRSLAPHKIFIEAPHLKENECPCNICPHMKKNTIEKLYLCMVNRSPEVIVPEEIRINALKPLLRMMEITASKPIQVK